ncbi:MAG: hypothetical protein EBT06_07410 [Gammaproteobacteria bacterium]|jgi:uncharacterized low-complexity protein|nr:hypothetical protein [Gammaproteobacteria bacterium]NBY23853.1 hypothetical protein [Gammaproteobacteria bacterium]NDE34692.1 hypothetical protein [Gammaproteobacteria bacterium]NDE56714.1 hypothetical protein [Gammaproteobacteria bacterium]NDG87896.1 hypothetical protein [Gammaproteobacteria bacterium]
MNKKGMSTVLGAAMASSFATGALATENPFGMKELAGGYVQVAEYVPVPDAPKDAKQTKEMVCGEGKCGGQMMKNPEMNCGAMMEQAKKSPQEESKAMEGKCAGMNMGQPATSK